MAMSAKVGTGLQEKPSHKVPQAAPMRTRAFGNQRFALNWQMLPLSFPTHSPGTDSTAVDPGTVG